MRVLLDTNVLMRLVLPSSARHQEAADAVASLRRQGDEILVVPQNFYEFWVVCTRPVSQNGLGLPPARVQTELADVRRLYTLLDDTPAILVQWEQLVTQYQVIGKNAHDARLVAAMLVHGISRLLTFNAGDFQRFPGITVLTPQQVLAPPP